MCVSHAVYEGRRLREGNHKIASGIYGHTPVTVIHYHMGKTETRVFFDVQDINMTY